MDLEDLNLESLSLNELRKLITLVSRETTLKRYKHECSDQVYCSSCVEWFCYACYNLHVRCVHGPQLAHFNEKLNTGSFFKPELRETKQPKTKIEVEVKIKVKREKKFKTPWGNFSQQEIVKLLESLGA